MTSYSTASEKAPSRFYSVLMLMAKSVALLVCIVMLYVLSLPLVVWYCGRVTVVGERAICEYPGKILFIPTTAAKRGWSKAYYHSGICSFYEPVVWMLNAPGGSAINTVYKILFDTEIVTGVVVQAG